MYGIHEKSGQLYECNSARNLVKPISREDYSSMQVIYRDYDTRLKLLHNCYKDATIHVFGSGPSLADVALKTDWSDHITIGVNGVPKVLGNIKYWLMIDDFFRDDPLYHWIYEWFLKNKSVETFVRRGIFGINLIDYDNTPTYLFDHAPVGPVSTITSGLFYGRSSTVAAADLARHMGAERIVLWGCDYNDRSHVYNDTRKGQWPLNQVESEYKKLLTACHEAGVELVNANPKSALKCVPVIDPLVFNEGVVLPKEEIIHVNYDPGRVISYDFEAEECTIFGEIINFNDLMLDKKRKFLLTQLKRMTALYLELK